jgi:hypothetical protein
MNSSTPDKFKNIVGSFLINKKMEQKKLLIEPLFDTAEQFGKTTFELYKLKALDALAAIAAHSLSRMAAILAFILFVFSANIGVALWLGELLGKLYFGFFCIAGFYAVVALILYFVLHNKIKSNINDSIVNQILN